MKKRSAAILALAWLSAGASCAAHGKCGAGLQAEFLTLKNWALSRCLAKADKQSQAGDDASKSAAAYLEEGSADMEVYEKIDALVDSYLARKYSGSVPSEYNTMKCIDLYQSSELDTLVQRVGTR